LAVKDVERVEHVNVQKKAVDANVENPVNPVNPVEKAAKAVADVDVEDV
jgi:hypothetical protein